MADGYKDVPVKVNVVGIRELDIPVKTTLMGSISHDIPVKTTLIASGIKDISVKTTLYQEVIDYGLSGESVWDTAPRETIFYAQGGTPDGLIASTDPYWFIKSGDSESGTEGFMEIGIGQNTTHTESDANLTAFLRVTADGGAQVKVKPGLLLMPQGSAPSTIDGMLYYDSTIDKLKYYGNSTWNTIDTGAGAPDPHGSGSHSGQIFPGANQDLGAFYMDIDDIAVPANPASTVRRLFVNTATGELSVRTNGGSTISLESAGGGPGSGTQWTLPVWNTTTTLGDSMVTQDSGGTAATVSGSLTVNTIIAGVSDYDKFLVSDSGLIKFRTGAEVLSDIGAAASSHDFDTHAGDVDLTDLEAGSQGSIIVRGAADWQELVKGTTNYALVSTATDAVWAQYDYTWLVNVPSSFTPAAHDLTSASHTDSGLTTGDVLQATGTTTFAWQTMDHADLADAPTDAHHTEAHVLATTGPHTGTLPWSDLDFTTSSIADITTRTHASLSDAPTDAHHNEAHVLGTTGPHSNSLPLTDLSPSGAAQGSMMRYGASDWEVLVKGTSTQVLKSGATTIAWGTVDWSELTGTQPAPVAHVLATSGPHSGTLPFTDLAVGTQGSIIRRGAADWEEYILGTETYVLKAGATDAAWGQVNYSELAGTPPSDSDAIHDNVSNEFTAITTKTPLVDADAFIIEDSEASFVKKAVGFSALQASLDLGDFGTRDHGSLSDAPTDAHHSETHVLATTGPHTGTLPLTDLAVGTQGSIIRRGAADWEELSKGTTNYALVSTATDATWAQYDYTWLANTPSTFAPSAHDLTGASHTENATGGVGNVLRASGATTFAWATLAHADLSDAPTDAHHSETHTIATTGPHTDSLPLTDLSPAGAAQGSIMRYGSSDWEVLTKGTSTYVLKAGATTVAWDTVDWSELTGSQPAPISHGFDVHSGDVDLADIASYVQGSIIIGGASDWEALGIGTNTYVLKAGHTTAAWGQVDYSELSGTQPSDPDAIHDNVANEFTALDAKSSLYDTDAFIIEDGEALFVKKVVAFTALESSIDLGNLGTRTHASLSDAPTDAHHAEAHVLATTGPHSAPLPLTDLSPSGAAQGSIMRYGSADWEVLTKGTSTYVLKAGATTVAWDQVDYTELTNIPSTFTPSSHALNSHTQGSNKIFMTKGSEFTEIGLGADGTYLKSGGEDEDLEWGSITSEVDALIATHTSDDDAHHDVFESSDFTTAFASESLANLTHRTHSDLSDAPTDAHHSETHVLATTGPHSGTLPLTDLAVGSQGSIIKRGAADWEELVKGTTTYVLKAGASDVSWDQVDYTELTSIPSTFAPSAHTHDGDALQIDGITSDGGAFSFSTTGQVTFNQNVSVQGDIYVSGKFLWTNTDTSGDLFTIINTQTLTGQMRALVINLAGMTLSGENLYGIDVLMPSYSSGAEAAARFQGDGGVLEICTDTYALFVDAGDVKFDGNLTVDGYVHAGGSGQAEAFRVGNDASIWDINVADSIGIISIATPANGGIVFGSGEDTNLYRSAANTLKTDDSFITGGDVTSGGRFLTTATLGIGVAAGMIEWVPSGAYGGGNDANFLFANFDAADPTAANTSLCGLRVEFDGVDLTNNPSLYGIIIDMPASYSGGQEAGALFQGDGKTIWICEDTYALWVDAGNVKFDGGLTVDGTSILGEVTVSGELKMGSVAASSEFLGIKGDHAIYIEETGTTQAVGIGVSSGDLVFYVNAFANLAMTISDTSPFSVTLEGDLTVSGGDVTIGTDVTLTRSATNTVTFGSGDYMGFNLGTTINEISIDETLAGNSDNAVPTEQAVKAYVDDAVSGAGGDPDANGTGMIGVWLQCNDSSLVYTSGSPGGESDLWDFITAHSLGITTSNIGRWTWIVAIPHGCSKVTRIDAYVRGSSGAYFRIAIIDEDVEINSTYTPSWNYHNATVSYGADGNVQKVTISNSDYDCTSGDNFIHLFFETTGDPSNNAYIGGLFVYFDA